MNCANELLSGSALHSMFVLLKGATKEQAFKIGNEIAEAVTATNPKPVKLKFEKVLLQYTHMHSAVWSACASFLSPFTHI